MKLITISLAVVAAALCAAQHKEVKIEIKKDAKTGKTEKSVFIKKDGKWVPATPEEMKDIHINDGEGMREIKIVKKDGSGKSVIVTSGKGESMASVGGNVVVTKKGSSLAFSGAKPGGPKPDFEGAKKLVESLSETQRAKQEKQGYLTLDDLTPEQRKLIKLPAGESWSLAFVSNGQKLKLKNK